MPLKIWGRPARLGPSLLRPLGACLAGQAVRHRFLTPPSPHLLLQEKPLPAPRSRANGVSDLRGRIDRCHLLKVSFNRATLGSDRGRGRRPAPASCGPEIRGRSNRISIRGRGRGAPLRGAILTITGLTAGAAGGCVRPAPCASDPRRLSKEPRARPPPLPPPRVLVPFVLPDTQVPGPPSGVHQVWSQPCPVCLSGQRASARTKGSGVPFQPRAGTSVAG